MNNISFNTSVQTTGKKLQDNYVDTMDPCDRHIMQSLHHNNHNSTPPHCCANKKAAPISELITNNPMKDEDEFDGIGLNVACKLRRMDSDQRMYAELLINKVLIYGITQRLQEETCILKKVLKRLHKKAGLLFTIFLLIFICILLYAIKNIKKKNVKAAYRFLTTKSTKTNYGVARRSVDEILEAAIKHDKGRGCEVPRLDPFAKEIMALETNYSRVKCPGEDWVKCFQSKCKVTEKILANYNEVVCNYSDILYVNDFRYTLGKPVAVANNQSYQLNETDHVKVNCDGWKSNNSVTHWVGVAAGIRNITAPEVPEERKDAIDVLILAFDSTAKNGFIRKMPKSYEYITKTLKSTVLNGFNILGEGTPAALFPLLGGKNELEFPDVRVSISKNMLNASDFIFERVKKYGYRTAYLEDMAFIGTFQFRFNGFNARPADHYLRHYLLYHDENIKKKDSYCVGDTPAYKLLMNLTDQFFQTTGKHFCLTFISEICHNEFSRISSADEDTVEFLDTLYKRGVFNRTLLIVMGDHGPRYTNHRKTIQGKFEERLPLMTILLPNELKRRRPEAQAHLDANSNVLMTAHDLHATVLDAMDLNHLRNTHVVKGADIMRGLSVLRPIPRSRSCTEAGVLPHWCTCVAWKEIPSRDRLYKKMAVGFVKYVNSLTQPFRNKCALRTINRIYSVMKQQPNVKLVQYVNSPDPDGYERAFDPNFKQDKIIYELKISLDPNEGLYEAAAMYYKRIDDFVFNTRDISRINRYYDEPDCIKATHPELNKYCYCTEIYQNEYNKTRED